MTSLSLRVAARHLRALQISKATVDQWKKDLRRMTQIYKTLDPEDQDTHTFEEARRLFISFRTNFEHWAYKVLLPKKSKDSTWLENRVRTKVWDALHEISDIFPSQRDESGTYIPAPWLLRNQKDKNIKRYQKEFLEAFKAIEEYLGESKLSRSEEYEQLEVAGVNVVVHSLGREDYEDTLEETLSNLKSYIGTVHSVGFGKVTKGLVLHVDFENSSAGTYNYNKDDITLHLASTIGVDGHVIWHELGHRFYHRFLSSNAREHWEEVMSNRSIVITREDINRFVDSFGTELKGLDSGKLLRVVQGETDSPELLAKFEYLVEHAPKFTTDLTTIREHLQSCVGIKVDLELITEYGATDPKEAFAECFGIICERGISQLKPWTRAFFTEISRSGGAKLSKLH
jgi:hypothetical protein